MVGGRRPDKVVWRSVAWVRAGREVATSPRLALYVSQIMAKSIPVTQKKRGRPATGHDPVLTIRLPPGLRSKIENWARHQNDKPSRSEAIRRLLEFALAAKS